VTPSPPQRDAPPPPPPSASMMDSPAFGGGLLFVDPSAPAQAGEHLCPALKISVLICLISSMYVPA